MDNVRFRNLEVERDVTVHGRILPIAEVQEHIARQIEGARQRCASADEAGFSLPGCPVKVTSIADPDPPPGPLGRAAESALVTRVPAPPGGRSRENPGREGEDPAPDPAPVPSTRGAVPTSR
jgi:hypothetical protein